MVLRVKKTFRDTDRKCDFDPVLGGAVLRRCDTVRIKPFMNEVQRFVTRLDKLSHIIRGKVLTVAVMARVGHYLLR